MRTVLSCVLPWGHFVMRRVLSCVLTWGTLLRGQYLVACVHSSIDSAVDVLLCPAVQNNTLGKEHSTSVSSPNRLWKVVVICCSCYDVVRNNRARCHASDNMHVCRMFIVWYEQQYLSFLSYAFHIMNICFRDWCSQSNCFLRHILLSIFSLLYGILL